MGTRGVALPCKCQMGSWIEGLSPGEELSGMCTFGSHEHKDGI